MIHKIKSLYDNGHGSSIRQISQTLNISRNTVRKYLRMEESKISQQQSQRSRAKRLDECRDYVVHLLHTYPKLSAVKVQRKLRERCPELQVSDRSVRRYVNTLRETVAGKQRRHYRPVLDMVPGVQCQIDPGELRDVSIGGVAQVVYFVVFVLSYSRLMYVALSAKPINTEIFIQMHDAAFRYFGGRPQECVYDQTKLVVLREEFRELQLNPRFSEYATHAGFHIHCCEGFDPESKGKVEAGVKYVKQNGLYGERFDDWAHAHAYTSDWLDRVANVRCHATTGKTPRALYEAEERQTLSTYLTPNAVHPAGQEMLTRKVDKTGLICWKASKYSVPMTYQCGRVGVHEGQGQLYVSDLENGEQIARHPLSETKGQVVRNKHHYRDRAKQVAECEQAIYQHVGEVAAKPLCAALKRSSPKVYKDQLIGAKRVLDAFPDVPEALLILLSQRPTLTATGLRDYLQAYAHRPDRWPQDTTQVQAHPSCANNNITLLPPTSALAHYADLFSTPAGGAS